MSADRRSYALAGALSVDTAELLRELHRAVGAPGDTDDVPPRRRGLLPAAARTYGAAAACNALAARLLLQERDAAAKRLDDFPASQIAERGVTELEESDLSIWRATVRATAAAAAELASAVSAWQTTDDGAGEPVVRALKHLSDYVNELSQILERSEPSA